MFQRALAFARRYSRALLFVLNLRTLLLCGFACALVFLCTHFKIRFSLNFEVVGVTAREGAWLQPRLRDVKSHPPLICTLASSPLVPSVCPTPWRCMVRCPYLVVSPQVATGTVFPLVFAIQQAYTRCAASRDSKL